MSERMDRATLRGQVQSVSGPIEPRALGMTLMHEHLIWDIRPPKMAAAADQGPEIDICSCWQINYGRLKVPRNLVMQESDTAIEAVQEMVDAGGGSIVELSSGGLRPDPDKLVQIAARTGAHIVMGCGHYVEDYQTAANREREADDFAAEMIEQIFEGAWGTRVRAGIIGEIGCQSPWTELEKRVMHGAILAQRETGASLNVHPGRHADQPAQIMDFVRAHGGLPERTILSHIDRTIFDQERLFALADTGAIIEFDLFGQENAYYSWAPEVHMPNDLTRLGLIRSLIDRGHLDQIVISHDICYKTRLTRYGGHGYGHIFLNVLPLMEERGFTEAEIDAIMIRTPAALLTFI